MGFSGRARLEFRPEDLGQLLWHGEHAIVMGVKAVTGPPLCVLDFFGFSMEALEKLSDDERLFCHFLILTRENHFLFESSKWMRSAILLNEGRLS